MTAAPQPTSIGNYYPDATAPQTPADIAVVMPTILRPCIATALESIYRQTFPGRIQVMVGVDVAEGDRQVLEAALARRPANVSALVLQLPYSTSARHGGVHTALDGGALRTLLSFLANARYVSFLDDDNTYDPEHLELLFGAVQGLAWAHSQRMLVDEATGEELAIDRWDSVGVGRGRFAAQGGFVDTNCLLVDKIAVTRALGRWAESGTGEPGLTADRNFFAAIKQAPHARVERATVRYGLRPNNIMRLFMRDGIEF